MLRVALIAFAALLALLVGLSLLPERARELPDSAIALQGVALVLYPQSDPQALWRFRAPEVRYAPASRETTLHQLELGERWVDGALDFTVQAERLTIGADDNLRGEALEVELVDAGWQLSMAARAGRQVLIDQARGVFEIPRVEIRGEGIEGVYENMVISFDLTEFTAGGEGTVGFSTFELGGD